MTEEVYVFEEANFDEMKELSDQVQQKLPQCGSWSQKRLYSGEPLESLISEAHRKINERIHLLKIHSSPQ